MRTHTLLVCLLALPALCADTGDAFVEPVPPAISAIDIPVKPVRDRLWKVSLVSLAAAHALDIHSSWGKREMNQALASGRGTFGLQGAAIKLGMFGGLIGVQRLLLRGQPNRTMSRIFAIVNFGSASMTTATAMRNYGVARPPR
jgi:hypothetical protein